MCGYNVMSMHVGEGFTPCVKNQTLRGIFLFPQFSGNVSEISVEIADLNDFLSAIRQLLLLLTSAKI